MVAGMLANASFAFWNFLELFFPKHLWSTVGWVRRFETQGSTGSTVYSLCIALLCICSLGCCSRKFLHYKQLFKLLSGGYSCPFVLHITSKHLVEFLIQKSFKQYWLTRSIWSLCFNQIKLMVWSCIII